MKLGKTQPYVSRQLAQDRTMLPMVMYAKSIGKNTAEFTQKDLRKFLRWLWQREPYKHKLWVPVVTTYFGKRNVTAPVATRRRRVTHETTTSAA